MYILDTSVFIEAKQRYYDLEVVPGFWDWLDVEYRSGVLVSVQQVLAEILARDDELTAWAKSRGSMFCLPDHQVQIAMGDVSAWALTTYAREYADNFLNVADSQIVAFAKAHAWVVVTNEQPEGPLKKRKQVKIPDVCRAMNVTCVGPFKMLKDEHARFVRDTHDTRP
ncbi:MAG: DUF4411 family protein [Propionibacteriaceae bacterium]|nr:DUF4411 family protein [Propionibacteriaceae bacterium]